MDLHDPLTELFTSGDLWFGDKNVRTETAEQKKNKTEAQLPTSILTSPLPASLHELSLENSYTQKLSGLWSPPLFAVCQILKTTAGLQRASLSLQANSLLAAWVGRRAWPTVNILDSFLKTEWRHRCLFLAPEGGESRLWTATQILRSGCFSVVVLDGTRFDFTATRRIQLAAREGNTAALLIRPPWEIAAARSAAVTRWLFSSIPGERPRWKLTLKRARGIPGEPSWVIELERGGLIVVESPSTGSGRSAEAAERRRNAG